MSNKHRKVQDVVEPNNIHRGSSGPCGICGVGAKNSHSLRESGRCDGIKNGHLDREGREINPKS